MIRLALMVLLAALERGTWRRWLLFAAGLAVLGELWSWPTGSTTVFKSSSPNPPPSPSSVSARWRW